MPVVEPSQATPRTAMIWVAKTVASRSATATTISGISHSTGLR
jgi:hypothetical protein